MSLVVVEQYYWQRAFVLFFELLGKIFYVVVKGPLVSGLVKLDVVAIAECGTNAAENRESGAAVFSFRNRNCKVLVLGVPRSLLHAPSVHSCLITVNNWHAIVNHSL